MSFRGFGAESQRFLAELSVNNEKAWFTEHRGRYETEVLEPATDFVNELGTRLSAVYPDVNFGTQRNGTGSILRIYRDVRFSKDKRPYKDNLGVLFWVGAGKKMELPCFYFHLDPSRIFFYGGLHTFSKPVLEKYRAAVDDARTGEALTDILERLSRDGLRLMEEPSYKRVPRGYPNDHPREQLLRHTGVGVGIDISPESAASPALVDECFAVADRAAPLLAWLRPLNE